MLRRQITIFTFSMIHFLRGKEFPTAVIKTALEEYFTSLTSFYPVLRKGSGKFARKMSED